jgi:nucleotide-binding universal stress UspA family protein
MLMTGIAGAIVVVAVARVGRLPLTRRPVTARAADRPAGDEARRRREIVVGLANDLAARRALSWAYQAAVLNDAALLVVTAYPHPNAIASLDGFGCIDGLDAERAAGAMQEAVMRAELGIAATDPRVHHVVAAGDPIGVLVDVAQGADILVVGRRQSALRRWLTGSVSSGCINHARGPVVIVRADPHTTDSRGVNVSGLLVPNPTPSLLPERVTSQHRRYEHPTTRHSRRRTRRLHLES